MYKMIGGDGQEYGPVSAEQIREWLAENRANGQTLVQPEGATDWRPLSACPEFADALGTPPAAAAPPPIGSWDAGAGEALTGEGELQVMECLGRGWLLVREHPALILGGTALVLVILLAAALATCVGGFISLAISGALHGGLLLMYLRLRRGQPANLATVFSCFGTAFVPLMFVWIITHFLSGLGLVLCLVPGLVLKVLWVFSLMLAADRGLDFWTAMETSRKAVMRQPFAVAGLLTVAYLPLLIYTVWSSYDASVYFMNVFGDAFARMDWSEVRDKLQSVSGYAFKLELRERFVVLLNLPFAYAALVCAYEQVFGRRGSQAD